jgi:hypothetical protein
MTFMSPAQGAPRYAFEFGPPASSAVHANVPLGEVSRANARFDDLIETTARGWRTLLAARFVAHGCLPHRIGIPGRRIFRLIVSFQQ